MTGYFGKCKAELIDSIQEVTHTNHILFGAFLKSYCYVQNVRYFFIAYRVERFLFCLSLIHNRRCHSHSVRLFDASDDCSFVEQEYSKLLVCFFDTGEILPC